MLITLVSSIETANSGRMVPALRALAARNLADKRKRSAVTWQAKARAAAYRPAAGAFVPGPAAASVPLVFKAARPERKRVTRAATSTRPLTYTPVMAKDVPADVRAVTKVHRDAGDLSAEWLMVGFTDDPDETRYYARKHGASVRYAVAA
ncbi:hypothetical protein [Streptomyces sp. CBMA29]|uniref:hypothetical protein n=1 Tax=Streptomyces sp. CBMA29 TaxID=1896314 RepID=UPI001661FC2F|nr:hypothetical protein [Streptomyces sp. CBMA29]MBD0734011.1 hypothetical protein [Streptomyces sp. CBMA29]